MANEGLTLVRDRWYTALTADVSAGATTLPVVTNTVGGNVLPTPCIIMCGFEQMYATASTATTITVTRGFNSTAAAHAKGATVGIARVAAHHNDVVTSLAAIGGSIVYAYTGGSMHNGAALTGATEFAFLANQTFSVTSTSSVIGIFTTGGGQVTQTSVGMVTSRMYIDSAGANTLYYLGGQRVMVAGEFANPFTGHGGTFFTGLSAGSHTVNFKLLGEQSGLVYQRANGYESFGFDVVEWA
jgi:hypothetical protein